MIAVVVTAPTNARVAFSRRCRRNRSIADIV
jgi:hypothetical protein